MSGIMSMLLGAVSSAAAAADEFFNRVTLLLNTSSTNGAQNNTFLDSSSNNFTITRNGNTTQGTFTPFSQTGWSNYFDGTGDYLSVSNASLVATGDFTLEAWCYTTRSNAFQGIISFGNSANSSGVRITQGNTGNLEFWINSQVYAATALPLNQWNHVALVRSGTATNNISCYLNGNRIAQLTQTGSTANSTGVIGRYYIDGTDQYHWLGYISGARHAVGSVVYSGATYTVPTAPSSPTGATLLTCQSNRFIDISSNAFTITRNGDTSVQAFSPFAPTAAYDAAVVGGSGYFDGTGDYLSLPYSSQLQFTGDFTIEFWAYPLTQVQSAAGVINNYSSWPSSTGFAIFCGHSSASSTKWCVALFGTFPAITSTNDFIKNAWSHIALVRNGTGTNNITLYVNGVASGTTTSNNTVTGTANNWWIGTTGDTVTQTFTGYLAGLRAINSAAYTSAFTPPTAPLAAGSNKLLLNYTNAGIYDAAAKNVLETVGNAQVSTTQAKFGTTSMYFDGTGDQLLMPASQNFEFGTGNHTVECWVYLTATTGSIINYSNGQSTNSNFAWEIYQSSSSGIQYSIIEGGTVYTASSTGFSINAWNHVAGVRNGNTLTIYVNGTAGGTTATVTGVSVSVRSGVTLKVSGYNNATGMITGYVDDLRISKLARYTANFTPATAAFPIQ